MTELNIYDGLTKEKVIMKAVSTARLKLRMINEFDAAFIQKLYSSEDFLRFIGDKQINSLDNAAEYIQNNILNMYLEKGVCLLLVEEKETGQPIGVCGLIKRDTLEAHDIGYGFLPEFYGKGYAFEASQAIIQQAKHKPDIDHVVAITTSDNIRSIKLLESLGFTFQRVEEILSEEVNLNLYGLHLGSN